VRIAKRIELTIKMGKIESSTVDFRTVKGVESGDDSEDGKP
jgi:major membrane immunogen (membrane-anchored lipoprotein)